MRTNPLSPDHEFEVGHRLNTPHGVTSINARVSQLRQEMRTLDRAISAKVDKAPESYWEALPADYISSLEAVAKAARDAERALFVVERNSMTCLGYLYEPETA